MFNLIKKIFNKNKKVTPTIITDRLIKGVIEFIQNRKHDLNPRFTYFDESGKKQPLYVFDSHFPEDSDTQEKLLILSRLLRVIHLLSNLQASMTFAYGIKDGSTRIQARYAEPHEESDCVIVDLQTPDGPAYVVVDYSINADNGQIGDREMFPGSERVFFTPGQVYSRFLDDRFVFFKVLKVENKGIHILCYGNEVYGDKISEIISPENFHFECDEETQEFFRNLGEQMGSDEGTIEFDVDELYDSIIGTCHVPGSHMPLSWDLFDDWDIDRHTFIPVEDHELNGFRRWESDSGEYF